jgi:molybdopterin molybdotransferase
MPADADTVFMQEDVRLDGTTVALPPGLKLGANRRTAGEDVRLGATIIARGRRLRPQDLALAAALGRRTLPVARPLRVALLSTGEELREPGEPLDRGAIYDSNRIALIALLRRLGCTVTDLGILRDDPHAIAARLRAAAAGHDLIVTSGGVSTGEEDHVRAAIEQTGRLVFWRLAIKPGRPVAMGVIDGTPLVGLPGNPVAVYVTFAWLVRPLALRLMGVLPEPPLGLPVRAAFRYRKKAGRREYVRVSLHQADDGTVEAVKFAQDGAGVLTSLTATDGLVELGETVTGVEPGTTVRFFSYAELT